MPGINVRIYECEVTGVRPDDRVLDARSRNGSKFKNVSYVLPYLNLLGGGFDYVPRSGDSCLIAAEDQDKTWGGRWSVCMGFKSPITPDAGGLELGGRIADLPPGSVVMRAVDKEGNEARVVCYAGGSVLIGTGEACSTLYSPADQTIIHLFNQWEMYGPGGHVLWTREVGGDAMSYKAQYRTKANEEDEGLRVDIDIGGDDDSPIRLDVTQTSGQETPVFTIRVDKNGEAWIEGESLNFYGKSAVDIDGGKVTIKKREVLSQKDPI